jgi:4a-hydroxytetrahydrobiopterin dehydratase
MPKLTAAELQTALQASRDWALEGELLTRTFQFENFVAAIAFVNRVADYAEQAAHHPDIDIRYNRVRIGLTTHDVGGISEKDVALAAQLDSSV